MGIPIVRYECKNGLVSWGRLEGSIVRPIPGAADSLSSFLSHKIWKQQPAREEIPLSDVKLLSPVTAPCQIICQGKNYLDHMLETGVKPSPQGKNILFTKADSALAPPLGSIHRPKGVRLLDYEIELGIVIGAPIDGPKQISENNLSEYVAGLVIANDISARDIQVPQRQ